MLHRFTVLSSVSVITVLGLAAPAPAADAPKDSTTSARPDSMILGEVIVTARRRDERLSEVPSAATVIDAGLLENRGGATSGEEIFAGQPSVRFFSTSSPINSEVAMRGSATSRGTNADPSVGLYRNGASIAGGRLGGRNFARLDLFDVGRVEVLRGTQGALYGRNAVGGAVNVISQQPQFETSGYVDVKYGLEPDGGEAQGVLNFALNDMFAVRVGGGYVDQKDDGFFYNAPNDVYFDRQYGDFSRAQIRMSAGRFDGNLLVEHQDMVLPAVRYRVYILPTPPRFPLGYIQEPFSYPWSTEPLVKQEINDAILTLNYDLGWADFVSTTFARERDSFNQIDPDALDDATYQTLRTQGVVVGAFDPNTSSALLDQTKTLVQDFHVSGDLLGRRLTWLLGLEYLDQVSESVVTSGRTPSAANGQSPGTRSPVRVDYESGAVYGSLGYDFTSAFNLTAEARYTEDDKASTASRFDLRTGLPTGGAAFNNSGETSPDNLSYNLTASYDIAPVLTYAKVGTSYRAGSFNTNLGDPRQPVPIPVSYEDETSTVYEIGLKGDVRDNLYIALAGYRSYSEDLIVQLDNGCRGTNPVCPITSTQFLTNAGEGEVWGVEVEAVARAEFAGGQLRASIGGSRQDGEVVAGPYEGSRLPQIADWTAGAELNYRRPFIGSSEIFGNVQYNAQWGGRQELDEPSPPLDDFQIVNLRAGLRFSNSLGSLDITGYVNNVTDEIYVTFGDATTTHRLSMPRTYGVQLRQRW